MASSSPAPAGQHAKGTVLIVDDEEGMRDLLKTLLEGYYHIAEADSGAALHKALEQDQPDVVLLDMKLPDANGLNLLPAIKQRWAGTEVIMLTGTPADHGTAGWATEAVNRGAFSFMSKSAGFSFQELLGGISLALQRRRDNLTA
jgi:two-component system, NtrC family, response regulator